jgi:PAS domain S-box-containing protein
MARLCALAAIAIGLAVLVGWAFDISALKTVLPGSVTMKANTALGVVLCGLALALLSGETERRPLLVGAGLLGLGVALLGGLSLLEELLGRNFGIDQWLFRDGSAMIETSNPGRMSPASASSFLLMGTALLVSVPARLRASKDVIFAALGGVVVAIGGMSAVGSLLVVLLGFHFWNFTGMAGPTSVAFMLLGLGLLALARRKGGQMWHLDAGTTGGFLVGALLILALAGVSYNRTYQLLRAAERVSHTQEVLKLLQEVESETASLGSAQRSYVNTGDAQMLDPYDQVGPRIGVTISALRKLTADNPHQQRRLARLEPLIATRIEWGRRVIEARKERGLSAAEQMITEGPGTSYTTDIRNLVREMSDEEYGLLGERQGRQEAVATTTLLLLPLSVFLSVTILSLELFFLNAGIAERRRLESGGAQLAAIVESSDDAVIGKDLSGMVTSWNAAAERIFGFAEQEMIGQSILRLIPSERHREEESILSSIRRGQSVRHFDTERLRKDGSVVPLSVTVSAIRDAKGRIVGASKVARDITGRIQAEAALKASEGRYRTLFERAPIGIVIADTASYYIDANQCLCDMLGYTRDELIGLHASDIVAEREIEHVAPALETIKATSDYQREWIMRRKDGTEFEAEVIATTMPDGTLLGMIRDITERKLVERKIGSLNAELEERVAARTRELEEANRELEAFSYSVSHDLRAPLRAVDGFSHAVLEDFAPILPAEGKRHLQIIRDSAKRMGELIDDLLAFSRLSRQQVAKRAVNTEKLVRDAVAEAQSQAEKNGARISIGSLPSCEGDPALLKQVWVNLISNALKYSSKRGSPEVEIGSVEQDGGQVFFVRDNGCGFDMRYAGKLFGVFQRLHRLEEYEGTGVGLAIVQRVVHRHGGRVWAEAAVDRGATFYFTLKGALS